jgi:predicted PurR-regulated permease PerM
MSEPTGSSGSRPDDPVRLPAASAQADRDFIARSARWAIVAGAVASAVLLLLWLLKAALTPLAAAFVIAYLLDPIIDRFEARHVRRSAAIFLLLGAVGGGVFGFLLFVLPRLQREFAALAERMPGYLEKLVTVVIPQVERYTGIQFPHTLEQLIGKVRSGEIPLPIDAVRELLTRVLGTLTGTVSVVIGLLVIPILAYYLLVEFDRITARLASWIPPRHRAYVVDKAHTVDRLVSGFLRGQLLVAACLGLLYAVGFAVIGIDLAVGVGLLAGVMALVPYLGSVVAVTTASMLCVLKFGLDGHLLAVLGWYVLVQNFEGFVLTPRIVGGSVGLHPAVVIVALLIGGDLFGFLGLLIAVPGAAVVKVFVEEAFEAYRRSSLFAGGTDGAAPPGG